MIDEAEKQRMIEFLRNPHPITLEFESTANQPDLFRLMGIDEDFGNEYCGEYDDDETEDEISVWPDKIVKSGRATIVFWEDGTKTVVKRSKDEPDNEYNAFCAALAIHTFGSNSMVKKIIKDKTIVQKSKKITQESTISASIVEAANVLADGIERMGKKVQEIKKELGKNDTCPIDKPCKSEKSTMEHDLDSLNEKAKAQYKEYLDSKKSHAENSVTDMWTCPNCGAKIPWQNSKTGRWAFCPRCQTATKQDIEGRT